MEWILRHFLQRSVLIGGGSAIFITLLLPALIRNRSLKGIVTAVLVAVFVVIVPLFVFFVSAFLAPDSKAAARLGWFDCWHLGKLALTPIVLWATGALFAVENRLASPGHRGIAPALLLGAITAWVCCIYGFVTIQIENVALFCLLLIPAYIALWHTIRAVQGMCISPSGWVVGAWTLCGSFPLWILSVLWSRHIYTGLPAESGCFVVTAASRGHESFVGPFFETQHRGGSRRTNAQLATLWQFEILWRTRAPGSHTAFRRVYNRCGPLIAARINSPWIADVTWIALKPIEWFASVAVNKSKTETV